MNKIIKLATYILFALAISITVTGASKYLGPADFLIFSETTTPSSPSSGYKIYGKSDGIYSVNSSGTEKQIDAAAGAYTVVSKSGTYTVLSTESVVLNDVSGGAYTLTLYTAVGNSGNTLIIKKTDSSTNILTVDGNASETIGGSTTTTLNTEGETLFLVSDGSNWRIVSRKTRTPWASYTPSDTTGFGTITNNTLRWRRIGDSIQVEGGFATGTVTASTARLELPNSWTIGNSTNRMYTGEIVRSGTASPYRVMAVGARTYFTFGAGAASHGDVAGNTLLGSTEQVYLKAEVHVSGWNE